MIRCDEALRLLDDHIDGTLGTDRSAEVAAHLASCASCRRVESATREVLAAAAELPAAIEPPRDLWPGIAARLGAPVVPLTVPHTTARLRRWFPLAAAAVLLVAATAALTARWVAHGPVAPAGAPPAAAVPARLDADAALANAIADYGHAAEALKKALAQHRPGMPAGTRRVVDENLAVVDGAIAALTRAVTAQPGNRDLTLLLSAAYQQQIELLETANQLSRT